MCSGCGGFEAVDVGACDIGMRRGLDDSAVRTQLRGGVGEGRTQWEARRASPYGAVGELGRHAALQRDD